MPLTLTAQFRALPNWGLVGLILALGAFAPLCYAQDEVTETPAAEAPSEGGLESALQGFDAWFGRNIVAPLSATLFYSIGLEDIKDDDGNTINRSIPLIVIVLVLGGIFFTFRYGFVNIRLFRHSIDVIRGKYDRPEDTGEISHFKALTSALSATVGLGNIAGVALAIAIGGPGAVFWMWLTAFFGMSMKFSSCTFAQIHRRVRDDGHVLGGPMVYLEEGLKDVIAAPIAKAFAVFFAILTVFAAFGGGNMFQSNQTATIIALQFFEGEPSWTLRLMIGVVLAVPVGVVLIGGIRRIGDLTSMMVPAMCLFYCAICLLIIGLNVTAVPGVFRDIFVGAFSGEAIYGGFIGVLVFGMRRAAFSNEAGFGSAAIAHAAARTEEPVREGVVAMVGPFIDTIVVCSMTALAILVTESHLTGRGLEGVEITARAFSQLGSAMPYVLCLAVFVFAFSTVVSWGYYGERAVEYLFGSAGILPYRIVYVAVVVIGPILSLSSVVDFSDIMLLSMAFPNLIGMALMSGKVREMSRDYIRRLESGEMRPVS